MRVATIVSPPFTIHYNNTNNNSNDGYAGGVEVEIMKALGESFNFTPIFLYAIFRKILYFVVHFCFTTCRLRFYRLTDLGNVYENGSATGLLNDLTEYRVLFLIGRMSPNVDYHRRFDYTVQYMQVRGYYRVL